MNTISKTSAERLRLINTALSANRWRRFGGMTSMGKGLQGCGDDERNRLVVLYQDNLSGRILMSGSTNTMSLTAGCNPILIMDV
jgi:hypothetical protein